jgi:hypothetical protein
MKNKVLAFAALAKAGTGVIVLASPRISAVPEAQRVPHEPCAVYNRITSKAELRTI